MAIEMGINCSHRQLCYLKMIKLLLIDFQMWPDLFVRRSISRRIFQPIRFPAANTMSLPERGRIMALPEQAALGP